MKDKKKWKKIIPFALLALGTSTVAVACSKKPVSEIGPEAQRRRYFKFQFLLRRIFGRHGDVGGRSTYADLRKRYDALFEKGQL